MVAISDSLRILLSFAPIVSPLCNFVRGPFHFCWALVAGRQSLKEKCVHTRELETTQPKTETQKIETQTTVEEG
jgi:hypothetical protein